MNLDPKVSLLLDRYNFPPCTQYGGLYRTRKSLYSDVFPYNTILTIEVQYSPFMDMFGVEVFTPDGSDRLRTFSTHNDYLSKAPKGDLKVDDFEKLLKALSGYTIKDDAEQLAFLERQRAECLSSIVSTLLTAIKESDDE